MEIIKLMMQDIKVTAGSKTWYNIFKRWYWIAAEIQHHHNRKIQ